MEGLLEIAELTAEKTGSIFAPRLFWFVHINIAAVMA